MNPGLLISTICVCVMTLFLSLCIPVTLAVTGGVVIGNLVSTLLLMATYIASKQILAMKDDGPHHQITS